MTTKIVDSRIVSIETEVQVPLDIQRPYSMHVTGKLLPRRVDFRWEREQEEVWLLVRASVSGPRIKNDGTPGKADATTWFVSHGRWVQSWAKWVEVLAETFKPTTVI